MDLEAIDIRDPVDRYEALRSHALEGTTGEDAGLAVFLRQGMAAWMDLGRRLTPAGGPKLEAKARATSGLPGAVFTDLVAVLAGMVVQTLQEMPG